MSVYLKAIEVIETRGWTQGRYQSPAGQVCALGACNLASNLGERGYGDGTERVRFNALYTAVKLLTGQSSVASFNDQPGRTKEEVINLLRKAHEYECARVAPTEDSSVPQV